MSNFRDRVKDSSSSTGTGSFTVSGTAPTGFQSFATAFQVGDPFDYCISSVSGGQWEVGMGYLSASTTLIRSVVYDGSSGVGVTVNFTSGTKDVFVTISARSMMDSDFGVVITRARGQGLR
jgi:hypothetical protein